MSTLFAYQKTHVQSMIQKLESYDKVLDVSKTGAGKTITSLHVYNYYTKTNYNLIVICPPTLIEKWKSHIDFEITSEHPTKVISSFQIKKHHHLFNENTLVIVDECHLFKNQVKRTDELYSVVTKSGKIIFLSATPIDDKRQEPNIKKCLGKDVTDKTICMNFSYDTRININLRHFNIHHKHKEYIKGHRLIRSCSSGLEEKGTFVPELYTAGMEKIHNSLFPSLLKFIEECRRDNSTLTTKYVIVLKYMKHFQHISERYPNILVLNGKTKKRSDLIKEFQTNNSRRMIAISETVGGVGIELDDTKGDSPRHIVMLPTTNGINFTQIIGRVQRHNTRSNSRVTIIQPLLYKTYFKGTITTKLNVVRQFNKIPPLKHIIHDHTCCDINHLPFYMTDLNNIILEYVCTCLK